MPAALLLLLALTLSACGMNRAVGVLPNTLDDLAEARAGASSRSGLDSASQDADARGQIAGNPSLAQRRDRVLSGRP